MWKWIARNATQLQILFAAIAAIYAMVEYRVKVHDDKVAQALTVIEKYDGGNFMQARARLDQFWISGTVKDWTGTLKKETPQVRKDRYNKELPELVESAGLTPDVYSLLGYYKRIALCVKSQNCDLETICQYLFDDIQGYRENYRAILVQWKTDLGDIGPDEIAHLTQDSCSVRFANYCKELSSSPYCQKS